jgi:GH15 family glucan-1,4-alpha-glucosidase
MVGPPPPPPPVGSGIVSPLAAPGSAQSIEDHALIGDCRSAALVGRDGAIDWLCWPRFDSPACFAALLGTPENGQWRIAPIGAPMAVSPASPPGVTRRYLGETLVLETLFQTATGSVALIDLMALDQQAVIRIVEGRAGSVAMRSELILRFQYGAILPWVTRLPGQDGIHAIAGPDQVVLRSDPPSRGEGMTTVADFTVRAGERVRFALAHGASHHPPVTPPDPDVALETALARWAAWSAGGDYRGRWEAAVRRSLLTLKALSYQPTGGMVAAPTTSLPEWIGGTRNWDYRYCWLRDSACSLRAMMRAGHAEEARAWGAWLRRAVAGSPEQMQVLYGVAGERAVVEWQVPWLGGHQGSRPVRVGNAASTQTQLDVQGEVLDALCLEIEQGLAPAEGNWALIRALVTHLETLWQQPDEGIWEVRGPRRHFTFSKAMAWVAFDRAVRLMERFDLPGPLARWRELRDRIHALVCDAGVDPARGCFTQSFGSTALDASLLLLPAMGFLPAADPRIRATIEAIGRDLSADGLILRYRTEDTDDGLPAGEGVFLACSFWYVDALVLTGRRAEAEALFTRLLSLCNDVGLLAEEYDPAAGRQLGNFPQAFSHLALINSALTLDAPPHAVR